MVIYVVRKTPEFGYLCCKTIRKPYICGTIRGSNKGSQLGSFWGPLMGSSGGSSGIVLGPSGAGVAGRLSRGRAAGHFGRELRGAERSEAPRSG